MSKELYIRFIPIPMVTNKLKVSYILQNNDLFILILKVQESITFQNAKLLIKVIKEPNVVIKSK